MAEDREDFDPNEWGNIPLPGMTDEELHSKNWNRITAVKEAYKDPKLRQAQRLKWLGRKHKKSSIKKIKNANVGKKRKGESWIKGMAEKKLGNQYHAKPFMTPSGAFLSKKKAIDWALSQGVRNPLGKFDNWLKSKPDEFYYISKEEYNTIKDNPKKVGLLWMENSKRSKTSNVKFTC